MALSDVVAIVAGGGGIASKADKLASPTAEALVGLGAAGAGGRVTRPRWDKVTLGEGSDDPSCGAGRASGMA